MSVAPVACRAFWVCGHSSANKNVPHWTCHQNLRQRCLQSYVTRQVLRVFWRMYRKDVASCTSLLNPIDRDKERENSPFICWIRGLWWHSSLQNSTVLGSGVLSGTLRAFLAHQFLSYIELYGRFSMQWMLYSEWFLTWRTYQCYNNWSFTLHVSLKKWSFQ